MAKYGNRKLIILTTALKKYIVRVKQDINCTAREK